MSLNGLRSSGKHARDFSGGRDFFDCELYDTTLSLSVTFAEGNDRLGGTCVLSGANKWLKSSGKPGQYRGADSAIHSGPDSPGTPHFDITLATTFVCPPGYVIPRCQHNSSLPSFRNRDAFRSFQENCSWLLRPRFSQINFTSTHSKV